MNLKRASFVLIMFLREGLTHIHSQKKPRLLFDESFILSLFFCKTTKDYLKTLQIKHRFDLHVQVSPRSSLPLDVRSPNGLVTDCRRTEMTPWYFTFGENRCCARRFSTNYRTVQQWAQTTLENNFNKWHKGQIYAFWEIWSIIHISFPSERLWGWSLTG